MLGYCSCSCCGSKIREDKWDKHCKTKRHKSFARKSIYDEKIFNSTWMTKNYLVFSFIPRDKSNKIISWRKK